MQLENSAGTHVIGVERGKQRAKKHGNGVKRGKLLARFGKRIKRGNTRSPLNVTSDHFANGLVFFFVLYSTEALSTADIPKLKTKVVDVIPPEVIEDMSVSQLQVKTFIMQIQV